MNRAFYGLLQNLHKDVINIRYIFSVPGEFVDGKRRSCAKTVAAIACFCIK